MTNSVETVFSMEDTESSDYLSSCDSVYSLDSASNIDDDYEDFDVFLSDGCEDEDKDAMDKKGRQGDDSEIKRLVLSPEVHPTPSRKSSLKCLDHQYRTLNTGLQSMRSPCSRYPFQLDNRTISSNHSWTIDINANVPVRTYNHKREEGGLKRSVQSARERDWDCTEHSITSESSVTKKSRERGEEGSWRRTDLSRRGQESTRTDGDRIFAEKCKELQGFIKPLTGLLNGLKRGRFERGLSSFQQSVAMDRIQRIVGVLQKPEMGERYLGTLLQVERMLKVWFPQVVLNKSSSHEYVEEVPEYKLGKENSNYSEIKSTYRQQSKRFACSSHSPQRRSPTTRSPSKAPLVMPLNDIECEPGATTKESASMSVDCPVMNLTWMHTSPIPNPPQSQVDLERLHTPFGQNVFGPNINNCGFIVFLHNNSPTSPTYPRSTSLSPEKSPAVSCHLKENTVQTGDPPRSISAPGAASVSSSRVLEVDEDNSRSHSRLPTPSKRPETANPWSWNLVTELKAKEHLLCSS